MIEPSPNCFSICSTAVFRYSFSFNNFSTAVLLFFFSVFLLVVFNFLAIVDALPFAEVDLELLEVDEALVVAITDSHSKELP